MLTNVIECQLLCYIFHKRQATKKSGEPEAEVVVILAEKLGELFRGYGKSPFSPWQYLSWMSPFCFLCEPLEERYPGLTIFVGLMAIFCHSWSLLTKIGMEEGGRGGQGWGW